MLHLHLHDGFTSFICQLEFQPPSEGYIRYTRILYSGVSQPAAATGTERYYICVNPTNESNQGIRFINPKSAAKPASNLCIQSIHPIYASNLSIQPMHPITRSASSSFAPVILSFVVVRGFVIALTFLFRFRCRSRLRFRCRSQRCLYTATIHSPNTNGIHVHDTLTLTR